MLQRDYFIRLIEEFNAAVSRFLVKKEDDLKRDKELKDLYRQYAFSCNICRKGCPL